MSTNRRGVVAHVFDTRFYAKIAAVSFIVGAGFETIMLSTGFYPKVLAIEAERLRAAAATTTTTTNAETK